MRVLHRLIGACLAISLVVVIIVTAVTILSDEPVSAPTVAPDAAGPNAVQTSLSTSEARNIEHNSFANLARRGQRLLRNPVRIILMLLGSLGPSRSIPLAVGASDLRTSKLMIF